jgi:D-alanyl-lipoteichoic acid acyltransferase DltB (MBOAT superfamily)
MIFNSSSFVLFFVVVFLIYYTFLKEKTKLQNWLLLLSSYYFYGFANWRILPLLFFTTLLFYFLGIAIKNASTDKKANLLNFTGIISGIGLLVYFKYFNFFIDSFSSLFQSIGLKSNFGTFNIIMPLGISFFTFKLISYVIEIHRGKIEPCRDFVAFSTYISFFPTILSGPIDKPNTFIPQLQKKRSFNYNLVVDGSKQVLWGTFQKMVIADNIAEAINATWRDIPHQSSLVLILTALLYSVQMYTDFSGYSNMAIGIGKLLGFKITKNFNYPFFARNVAEYWRNWHMSLTSWLTDYVFMPLNIKFRDLGTLGMILAIIINMVLVGMWHGANWTFVVFGLYHGLLFIPLVMSGAFLKKKKLKPNRYGFPSLNDFSKMIFTFLLISFGSIIFRAENISQAWQYIFGIFDFSLKHNNLGIFYSKYAAIFFSLLLFLLEWYKREDDYAIANFGVNWHFTFRIAFYYILLFAILFMSSSNQNQFIYIQF